jgi:regulator of nucleoside diphosphate kinase
MSNTSAGDTIGLPPIRMTAFDRWKLDALLRARASARSWRGDQILRRELQRSIVMDESRIPPDVATMGSRVEFRVAGAAATRVATLVYPGDGHKYADALSVLTPYGAAILGLSEDQSIDHTGPDGSLMQLTLLRVLHQPETQSSEARRREAVVSRAVELL